MEATLAEHAAAAMKLEAVMATLGVELVGSEVYSRVWELVPLVLAGGGPLVRRDGDPARVGPQESAGGAHSAGRCAMPLAGLQYCYCATARCARAVTCAVRRGDAASSKTL